MDLELTKQENTYDCIETVSAIRRNENKVIQQLYIDVFPKIRSFILQNNGDEEQAKDIFQEAFVAFWRNIKTNKFNPKKTENMEAYLYTSAKNKWIDYLRSVPYRKKVSMDEVKELVSLMHDPGQPEGKETKFQSRSSIAFEAVKQLGENCQQLLRMFYFERKPMVSIAQKLKISNASARNKKYRCMQQLREYVKKHHTHEEE